MHISLEGKHALVGGSSKGIGRAIALRLAHGGAKVSFAARSESVLKELCDELQQSTGKSHGYLVVDCTDLQGYKTLSTPILNNTLLISLSTIPGAPGRHQP